jgi:diketogulonate reductase-like aldo/keto reductase
MANTTVEGEWKCPEIPKVKLNTGWEIPLVGFGTYHIKLSSLDKCIDAALAYGYRHIDTAKLYENEPELGSALERLLPKHGLRREDVFLTTKFFPPAGNAAQVVPQLIEQTLTNLRTTYIDLVLVHFPKASIPHADETDNDDPVHAVNRRESWLALESLPTSKVHSIGVSNFEPRHLEEIIGIGATGGYGSRVPAVNQVEYHPHFRRTALKDYCAEKGIFFQAFSSLGRQHPDLMGDVVVKRLAEKYGTSVGTILLSFATSQGVGVVPKSENPERIKENLQCLNVKLTKEELDELNSIPKDVHYIRTTGWLVK